MLLMSVVAAIKMDIDRNIKIVDVFGQQPTLIVKE